MQPLIIMSSGLHRRYIGSTENIGRTFTPIF